MSKYCSKEYKEIGTICDFCYYYDFNANKKGAYVNNGYCRKLKQQKHPFQGCNEFTCKGFKNG